MEVTNTASAVLRVTGRMKPRPVALIEFRRPPRFNDVVLSRLLRQVPNVYTVSKRPEGGYWIHPAQSTTSDELNKLISDLVALANVIV